MPSLSRLAFGREMVIVMEIHGKEWTDETIGAYYEALEDLDTDLVLKAFRELLQESPFMPKPADVRLRVEQIRPVKLAITAPLNLYAPIGRHDDDPRLCQRYNCESLECQDHILTMRESFRKYSDILRDPERQTRASDHPSYFELTRLHEIRPQARTFLRTVVGVNWLRNHPSPMVQRALQDFLKDWCDPNHVAATEVGS